MMEFVNGKDDIPYMKWKLKVHHQPVGPVTINPPYMLETTNQTKNAEFTEFIERAPAELWV